MEIKIIEHTYPDNLGSFTRPAPLITGSLLSEDPQYFKPTFFCSCKREIYDGGLCQAVKCSCGLWVKRSEDNQVLLLDKEPLENKCQSKGFAEQVSLQSVTFGVFADNIQAKYRTPRGIDYGKIITTILKPYFVMRLRCVEEGILFNYRSLKFKVLACYPRQGFVEKTTRVHLYRDLTMEPVREVEVIPLPPHIITEELFDEVFLPYFTSTERHLHTSQHIVIYGLECVISKTEPRDGFVVPSITEFNFSEFPVPAVNRIVLTPYIEDIPAVLSRLSENQLIVTIMNHYLMPYLKGWNHIMKQGLVIDIGGIDFKIREVVPEIGYIDENTSVFYNGKAVSRRRNPLAASELEQIRSLVREIEGEWLANKEKIDKLPEFLLEKPPESEEQKTCVICLTELETGAKVKTFPCCNPYLVHIFHKLCCEKWLLRNQTCPVCKISIS